MQRTRPALQSGCGQGCGPVHGSMCALLEQSAFWIQSHALMGAMQPSLENRQHIAAADMHPGRRRCCGDGASAWLTVG